MRKLIGPAVATMIMDESQWRPIKNAPPMTDILGYDPPISSGGPGEIVIMRQSINAIYGWVTVAGDRQAIHHHHWMPLPEPPEEEE